MVNKTAHIIINGDSWHTMNTSGGASIMGSFPHPRNGIVKLDFEYILLFKNRGMPRNRHRSKRIIRR